MLPEDASDIQPFFLYEQPDLPHLCPLRAYAEWVEVLSMSAISSVPKTTGRWNI